MRLSNQYLSGLCLICNLFIVQLIAQQQITNEAIWTSPAYYAQQVPDFNFMNDGRHYTRQAGLTIAKFDLVTGEPTELVFDARRIDGAQFPRGFNAYTFSDDEAQILIETERESIYRRSSKAKFWVFQRENEALEPLHDQEKVMYASFNPAGDKVAFVFENNLYVKDLASGKVTQVTEDGKQNEIINGALDWVYEEEFGFAKGFAWAPDGSSIAFYRFDESAVKEFTMTYYRAGLYPAYETFKYPKVGEVNSTVQVGIYHLSNNETVMVDVGEETDQYIPRIKWTKDPNQLCVYRLNRHQNKIELLLADAQSGETKVMLTEESQYYIAEAVFDNLIFLPDGKRFVWTSERNGWHHIYLYDMGGYMLKNLTSGDWEVSTLYGFDEKRNQLIFQAAKKNAKEREIYAVSIDGGEVTPVANEKGWNSAQFSTTFDYYVLNHSTINTPPVYKVFKENGEEMRLIEDNAMLVNQVQDVEMPKATFFSFTTSEGVALNGYEILPANFSPNIKYPVLMYVYGGPGSQNVVDRWGGTRQMWLRMLAQQGFAVYCVDNRGTGGRGEAFKKMTYLQLGKYETVDQIEAAKFIGSKSYIDEDNIAIFGWSYGGYMSSLCILKGSDAFKSAIAVAPVTSWKWYDTIYTERYMRTVEENPDGYYDNSPVYFADRLKGNYLLVHGIGDDNVHFQHTAEMANALIKANKQFETYFYPNRNHGIYGDNARLHLYTKMTNFLQETLK